MIETLKLQPFAVSTCCPKCGAGEPAPVVPPSYGDKWSAGLDTVPAPLSPFIAYNGPFMSGTLRTRYCAGGKEPESEGELDPMVQITRVAASITGGKGAADLFHGPGKINICAGITEEHLHRICTNCEYEFLMQTKDSEETA